MNLPDNYNHASVGSPPFSNMFHAYQPQYTLSIFSLNIKDPCTWNLWYAEDAIITRIQTSHFKA